MSLACREEKGADEEQALVIPERISSLVLTSTKAGDKFDLPSLKVRFRRALPSGLD